jgi:glycerophosphoryl diester phosphodiesterase
MVRTILIIIISIIAIYGAAVVVSMFSVQQKKIKPFISALPEFTVVAHRGASMRHPGNTLESFKEALKINSAAMLELDVHLTKDGFIAVNHDDYIVNSAGEKVHVKSHTLKEIQTIDAGYYISFDNNMTYPFRGKGYFIPEFKDVLKNFKGTLISIDIKHHTIECADLLMKLISENGADENVIIGSFSDEIMNHIRDKYPHIATSFSKSEVMKFVVLHKLYLSGFFKAKDDAMMIPEFSDTDNPEYLGPGHKQGLRIITRRFIKEAYALNIPVMAWTINKKENMERLYSWGIRGVITDYPDILSDIAADNVKEK